MKWLWSQEGYIEVVASDTPVHGEVEAYNKQKCSLGPRYHAEVGAVMLYYHIYMIDWLIEWQIGHVRLASSYYHSIGESMSTHLLSELRREAKAKEQQMKLARVGPSSAAVAVGSAEDWVSGREVQ